MVLPTRTKIEFYSRLFQIKNHFSTMSGAAEPTQSNPLPHLRSLPHKTKSPSSRLHHRPRLLLLLLLLPPLPHHTRMEPALALAWKTMALPPSLLTARPVVPSSSSLRSGWICRRTHGGGPILRHAQEGSWIHCWEHGYGPLNDVDSSSDSGLLFEYVHGY
ncbi:hypothetical protein DAI22_09g025950 [Oryza sativa Japonica Group]|nr:hypothetical protein DAI22_09g025950 [Oryza sativa Japonica Group]